MNYIRANSLLLISRYLPVQRSTHSVQLALVPNCCNHLHHHNNYNLSCFSPWPRSITHFSVLCNSFSYSDHDHHPSPRNRLWSSRPIKHQHHQASHPSNPHHTPNAAALREHLAIIYQGYLTPHPEEVAEYLSQLAAADDPYVVASIPIAASKLAARSKLHYGAVLTYIRTVKQFTDFMSNSHRMKLQQLKGKTRVQDIDHVESSQLKDYTTTVQEIDLTQSLPQIPQINSETVAHIENSKNAAISSSKPTPVSTLTSEFSDYGLQAKHHYFGHEWTEKARPAFPLLNIREHASIMRSFAFLKTIPPPIYLTYFYAYYAPKLRRMPTFFLISPLTSFAILGMLPDKSFFDDVIEHLHMRASKMTNLQLATVIHACVKLKTDLPSYFSKTIRNQVEKRINDPAQQEWNQSDFIAAMFLSGLAEFSQLKTCNAKNLSIATDSMTTTPLATQDSSVVHTWQSMVDSNLNIQGMDNYKIQEMIQSLALTKVKPSQEFMNQYFKKVESVLAELPPRTLITILHSLSELDIQVPDVLLRKYQVTLLPYVKSLNPRDVVVVVSSFSRIRCKPLEPFMQTILQISDKFLPNGSISDHEKQSRTEKDSHEALYFNLHEIVILLNGLSTFANRFVPISFLQTCESLLDEHLSSLQPDSLALIGLALAKFGYMWSVGFQTNWEKFVIEKLPSFNLLQISMVLRIYDLRKTKAPIDLLNAALDKVIGNFELVDNVAFSLIVNSLSRILTKEQMENSWLHDKVIHLIIQFPLSRMREFNEVQLAALILSIGRIKIRRPDEFMELWYNTSLEKVAHSSPSELSRSMRGLSLGSDPVDPVYLERWLSRTVETLEKFNDQELMSCLKSLARIGNDIPREYLEQFRASLASRRARLERQNKFSLQKVASKFSWSEFSG